MITTIANCSPKDIPPVVLKCAEEITVDDPKICFSRYDGQGAGYLLVSFLMSLFLFGRNWHCRRPMYILTVANEDKVKPGGYYVLVCRKCGCHKWVLVPDTFANA